MQIETQRRIGHPLAAGGMRGHAYVAPGCIHQRLVHEQVELAWLVGRGDDPVRWQRRNRDVAERRQSAYATAQQALQHRRDGCHGKGTAHRCPPLRVLRYSSRLITGAAACLRGGADGGGVARTSIRPMVTWMVCCTGAGALSDPASARADVRTAAGHGSPEAPCWAERGAGRSTEADCSRAGPSGIAC